MLSIFWGCFVPTKQYCLEISTRSVLKALGIDAKEIDGWSCCGNPFKGVNPKLWLYLASRNLSLAREDEILTVCNGCYLSLKEAQHLMETSEEAAEWVERALVLEGLEYRKSKVLHPIEFFHDILSSKDVVKPLTGLRLGAHYGCHSIRGPSPSFDSATNPVKLEGILDLLGAEVARDYVGRLDCCGATLMGIDPEIGFEIASTKIANAVDAKIQGIVTSCPYCFEMLDSRQETLAQLKDTPNLPVLLLQQVIGLAMGLDRRALGLNFNMSPVEDCLRTLDEGVPGCPR